MRILLIALVLIGQVVAAKNMKVYKNDGQVVSVPVSVVDSIKFEDASRYTLDTNVVAIWTFDSIAGGVVTDVSGKGNDGHLRRTGDLVAGKSGNALYLHDSAYVNFGNIFPVMNQMTFECWVNFDATNYATNSWKATGVFSRRSFQSASYTTLELCCNGIARFGADGPSVACSLSTTASIGDNTWHYLAATKNGTMYKLYLDGALVVSKTQSYTFPVAPAADSLLCGYENGQADYFHQNFFYRGKIDDARLSKVARTDQEILDYWNAMK